jgi:hypothetical protein
MTVSFKFMRSYITDSKLFIYCDTVTVRQEHGAQDGLVTSYPGFYVIYYMRDDTRYTNINKVTGVSSCDAIACFLFPCTSKFVFVRLIYARYLCVPPWRICSKLCSWVTLTVHASQGDKCWSAISRRKTKKSFSLRKELTLFSHHDIIKLHHTICCIYCQ